MPHDLDDMDDAEGPDNTEDAKFLVFRQLSPMEQAAFFCMGATAFRALFDREDGRYTEKWTRRYTARLRARIDQSIVDVRKQVVQNDPIGYLFNPGANADEILSEQYEDTHALESTLRDALGLPREKDDTEE